MTRRSIVLMFAPFVLLTTALCAGCGQKPAAAPPPPPPANNTQYPPGYVQQRTAEERPMPLNTQTGK